MAAQKLQVKIGNPSTKDFLCIISRNKLPNCPKTRADVIAAEHIFGQDIGSIKGKTVQCCPHKVSTYMEAVPTSILKQYKEVTICMDIIFVNGIMFFITISSNMRFGTVQPIKDMRQPTIIKVIKNVRDIYAEGAFKVMWLLMDGPFELMQADVVNLGI